jgi:proteic killer suppression protein
MIRHFRNKGLKELFEDGRTRRIDKRMHKRICIILDALDRARVPTDMNVPGLNFHSLQRYDPTRYTVHVNGPWCVTFEFDGEDANRVDFEQYHLRGTCSSQRHEKADQ